MKESLNESTKESSKQAASDLSNYPLPGFIKRREGVLLVDLATLDSCELFHGFVDRLYTAGYCFVAGDYSLLQRILYELTPKEIGAWAERLESVGKQPEARLADDIVRIPDERRLFYRGWLQSTSNKSVEYFFEPIFLERVIEEPVFGEMQEDGEMPLLRMNQLTVNEQQTLTLDEFFASAWCNKIRFGWDIASIRAEFQRDGGRFSKAAKLTIAKAVQPMPGQDATLVEQTDSLHRSDRPKVLNDGRVDLTQFRNRFPQVKTGTRLLQKIPKALGVDGHSLSGVTLSPPPPADFSVDELAGPGTRVERNLNGEFVVATMDGFLNIDAQTNLISVTEKIVNREGVSVRTTGNLKLSGDEFEEHGEVQERRVVEGMNMTFMADVFGNIVSRGGRVSLQCHLAGGSAKSEGGYIEVLGGASRAVIEARGGEVVVKFAESSRIVGRKVTIERACLCDIVADEVSIEQAEGCVIAAKNVRIGTASPRKNTETIVVIPVPDTSECEKKIQAAELRYAEIAARLPAFAEKLQSLVAIPELKTFLTVQKRKASGEITMTPEQEAQFRALGVKAAPALKQMTDVRAAMQTLQAQQLVAEQEKKAVIKERADLLGGLRCQVEMVNGDTIIRTRLPLSDEAPLDQLPARDLSLRLREHGSGSQQIFAGSTGEFSWRWPAD